MKRHYIGLWLLLVVAFAAFAAMSALDEIKIGPVQLKSSGIAERLTAPVEPKSSKPKGALCDSLQPTDSTATADTRPTPALRPAPVEPDTTARTILIIGDSMLEGLSPRLADYSAANGYTQFTVIWYSSTSAVWGKSDRLADYLKRLKPDFVFLSLGSNELFVNNIKDKRRQYVEKIVADLDTIPYLWIGPPNWKDDTGINELIEESVPRGCYFKSAGMHFDRAKDGAHPTRTSAARWMDSIARWMPENSCHPIPMEHPADTKGKPKRIFVHQPNE